MGTYRPHPWRIFDRGINFFCRVARIADTFFCFFQMADSYLSARKHGTRGNTVTSRSAREAQDRHDDDDKERIEQHRSNNPQDSCFPSHLA